MTRIMMVCLGNICRSPMAECVMKNLVSLQGLDKEFVINSSATSSEEEGNGIYPSAVRKMREMGVPVVEHYATPLCREDYTQYDYIVGMEERNLRAMRHIFGGDPDGKIIRLLEYADEPRDIADPWWTGNFDRAYADIDEGCRTLLEHIRVFGNKVR